MPEQIGDPFSWADSLDRHRLKSRINELTEENMELRDDRAQAENERRDVERERDNLRPRSTAAGEAPDNGHMVLAFIDNSWSSAFFLDDGAFNWWLPLPAPPPEPTELERLRMENAQLRKQLDDAR